jgi:protease II
MDAGHGGASGRFEAIKELRRNLVLLDLEKIKSNSKNFKFGDDCRIINFHRLAIFSLKKK